MSVPQNLESQVGEEGHANHGQEGSQALGPRNRGGRPVVLQNGPATMAPAREQNGLTNTLLSCIAIALSSGAIAWIVYNNYLYKGLKKYDLSTPKASLASTAQMLSEGDSQALMEFYAAKEMSSTRAKEFLKTLKVRKELEFKGKMIVFFAFERDGVTKYSTAAFEKDAKTGYWLPADDPTIAFSGDKEIDAMKKKINSWVEKGELP